MKIRNLLLITGNKGKAAEFKKLIDIVDLSFSYKSLDLPEIQSFELEEIGAFKTRSAFLLGKEIEGFDAILTDDTGLFCKGLEGLPGPFIKWFLETIGPEGLYDLVKEKQKNISAVCLLTLGLTREKRILHFKGTVEGEIVTSRGKNGFGWDRIFRPKDCSQTYGEMELSEKNKISHRTLAVSRLRNWILG